MTAQLPVVTTWHTDTGIAIAITDPNAGPDDNARVAVLPSTTRSTCSCPRSWPRSMATPDTET